MGVTSNPDRGAGRVGSSNRWPDAADPSVSTVGLPSNASQQALKKRPRRRAPPRVWASWAVGRDAKGGAGAAIRTTTKIGQLSINRPVAAIGAGGVKSSVIWRPPSRWPFAVGTGNPRGAANVTRPAPTRACQRGEGRGPPDSAHPSQRTRRSRERRGFCLGARGSTRCAPACHRRFSDVAA